MSAQDAGVPCNSQLPALDSDSVIENLRVRHASDEVYTWTGTILLAVNPYKNLPNLYGESVMAETRASKLLRTPHAYSVAERAYRQMAREGANQSIVISGESGAGKTENCRIILQYLAARSRAEASLIEKRLLAANPILESFGCAKTLRNNNSSRFGKLVKTFFDADHRISASAITTYLLEKSRLVHHAEGERNYHIFYQLAAANAAGHPLARELAPSASVDCAYLARGNAPTIAGMDDLHEFENTIRTLELVGVDDESRRTVLRVLGGVLLLGEVGFDEDDEGRADPADPAVVARAAAALGMDVEQLHRCLRTRTVTSGRGSVFTVHFSAAQAATARDSLAKAVYERLFTWLVQAANASLLVGADDESKPVDEERFIATLDIFGFENFETNSFEQLLINYCNEKLQHQFLCHVVEQEQDLYRQEMISWRHLHYENNSDAVSLFEAYPTGLLWLMQEFARMPSRESAEEVEKKLTRRIHASHRGSKHLSVPRTRRGNALNSDDGFIVRHFAGDVCYSTHGFLEKNAENLHAELELLVTTSTRECVALEGAAATEPVSGGSTTRRAAASTRTVATGFMNQLNSLVDTLQQTSSHYVRAIKPNAQQAADRFNGELIKKQLDDSGMPQVLTLMHSGYPTRCPFAQLYEKYRPRAPAAMSALEPRMFIEGLLYALNVPSTDFQLGMTQLFFKGAGKMSFLESLLESDLLSTPEAAARIKRWLILKRFHLALSSAKVAVRFGRRLRQMRAATALAKVVRVLVRLQSKTVPLARKVRRVVWRRHAGEIIASAWRSRALRVRFAAAKVSIVKLQAHGRRLATRKMVAELREARRIEEEERFRLRSRKAARSIHRAWQCKSARAELAALRAAREARREAFRVARRARDLERLRSKSAAKLQATVRKLAALRLVAELVRSARARAELASAERRARASERQTMRAVKRVQAHWRGLVGRRSVAGKLASLSPDEKERVAAQRAGYVGSLREAEREVARARAVEAKAIEKVEGYQALLANAGTINGPDCSPVGLLPTPKNSHKRMSILGIMMPVGGAAKKGSVAPSPAPTSRRAADDLKTPLKENATLGLMSATLGPRLSAGKLKLAEDGDAPLRQILSPRGANTNAPTTPRYGRAAQSASFSETPTRHVASTGTPTYGSSKKEQRQQIAAAF